MNHGGSQPKHLRIDPVPAVGIQEAVGIFCRSKIIVKRPYSPEDIDVPVADTAGTEIDIARKFPVVQNDVRQAVIAVKQGIFPEQGQAFLRSPFCIFKGRELIKASKEIRFVMKAAETVLNRFRIAEDPVPDRAVSPVGLMQRTK